MIVYELTHTYYIYKSSLYYSCSKLGYYSDMSNIKIAISFYSELPGFCDAPNGFVVTQKEVIGAECDTDFYEALIYAHTEDFESYEHTVELGLFWDRSSAENAISLFCANNELFLKNPDLEIEQLIEKYTINEHCGWLEGFTVESLP